MAAYKTFSLQTKCFVISIIIKDIQSLYKENRKYRFYILEHNYEYTDVVFVKAPRSDIFINF